jgi:hypothetical protein
MHEARTSTSRVHLPEMHRAGYVRGMTNPNTLSRACFSILDGEHVRVLWSDLEAAFDLEGLAANPPLALIRNVLVRCGAPAWVWDAEAQIDQVGVMFRRASSRSAA